MNSLPKNPGRSIKTVCKMHNQRRYFSDGGLVGVYNHAGVIMWYSWTMAGLSGCGTTASPRGAKTYRIDELPANILETVTEGVIRDMEGGVI